MEYEYELASHVPGFQAALATLALSFLATSASAVTVTGTMQQQDLPGYLAYAFKSSNLTYTDTGAPFAASDVWLMCLDQHFQLPSSGTNYTFGVDPAGSFMANGGGDDVVVAMNYLVDTYFDSYLTNGDENEQISFQNMLWELSSDYDGTVSMISGTSGAVTYMRYTPTYMAIFDGMISNLQAALPTLSSSYRSTKYLVNFFDSPSNLQNLVTIVDKPTPNPVPVPAGLPLVLTGLGALGIAARRKRKQA